MFFSGHGSSCLFLSKGEIFLVVEVIGFFEFFR